MTPAQKRKLKYLQRREQMAAVRLNEAQEASDVLRLRALRAAIRFREASTALERFKDDVRDGAALAARAGVS